MLCPGHVDASLNYTITDQLYPRDKNSRDLSVQRVFFSLPARNPVSLLVAAPKSATHARIGERGSVHIVERLRPKNPNLPLGRPHCFVSGSPSPQNYPMVKRVSSNLVILVSLAQRQVFSWRSYTQGPNSQHQGAMIAGDQIWRYFSNLPHLQKLCLIGQLKALLIHSAHSLVLDRARSICFH